jgi:hypothetical protein
LLKHKFNKPEFFLTIKDVMMERIHAQDATGKWIKGVDVFAAAYEVGGFHSLSRI